ncbi:MAG: hypothetical protein HY610_00740, partial [Elusimicrobia bacterium]|nr:hypothetical protein [Elusimicrobiota bacterium]
DSRFRGNDGERGVSQQSPNGQISSLSGLWGKGILTGKANFSDARNLWNLSLKNFRLEDIFSSSPFSMSGQTTISVSGSGDWKDPTVRAKLNVSGFSLDREKMGSLSGSLFKNSQNFNLSVLSSNRQNRLIVDAVCGKQNFRFRRCELVTEKNGNAQISGGVEGKDEHLNLLFSARALSISYLKPFVKPLQSFEGRLFCQGRVSGSRNQPKVETDLTIQNVALQEGSVSVPVGLFRGSLQWDRDTLQISSMTLGSAYTGSYQHWKKPRKFEIRVGIENGNPKVVLALIHSSLDLSGTLDGHLVLSHTFPGSRSPQSPAWLGEGDLKVSHGSLGTTPLETLHLGYRFDTQKMTIPDLSIQQKEGSFRCSLETAQTDQKNPLSGSLQMKNFKMGQSHVDSELNLAGEHTLDEEEWFQGKLKSNRFAVNRFSAGSLECAFSLKSKILSLSEIAWGKFFKGAIRIAFPKGREKDSTLEGEWESETRPLKEWVNVLGLKEIPLEGSTSLSGHISGSLKEPVFLFFSKFFRLKTISKTKEGSKDDVQFNGTGSAIYSNGTLNSTSLNLETEDGGKLDMKGSIQLKEQSLQIVTAFEDLDAEIVSRAVGWRVFQGRSSGYLTVDGDWGSPTLKGEVRGGQTILGNFPLGAWEVAGTFRKNEISFTRVNLYGHRGSWRFSVLEDSWIRPAKENRMGTYRLATEFANIALGPVSFVGSGVLQGGWRQEPKSKQFIFRSGVKINDWLANGTDLKPIRLDMELEGKKIKFFPEPKESNSVEPVLSGEIDFSRLPCALFQNFTITQGNKKIFFLNGDLCLEKPSFQLEGTELDAGLISGLLQLPFSFSGSSRLTAQGSTENQTPVISGELKLENGSLDKIPLDSLESKFKWIPGNLSLLNFQAKSKDYFTVLAKGNFPWNTKNSSLPSSRMDLQIKVPRGNLSFLNFLETPWIKNAQGEFSTECNLKGSAKNPVLNGF